jgi:hypothetical protein
MHTNMVVARIIPMRWWLSGTSLYPDLLNLHGDTSLVRTAGTSGFTMYISEPEAVKNILL